MSATAPASPEASRFSAEGEPNGTLPLDPELFGIEANVAVMHQVVTAQLAAARSGTHSTRTRAEVRGGGAKPYRQKGTGRARQGSTRSPQFVGGGVALGPRPRSYRQRTPKKMVRLALRSALSDRAAEGRIAVVEEWPFATPRTKDAVALLEALGVHGKVAVVVDAADTAASRSFANLAWVQVITSSELNAYDILCNDWLVFSEATLPGSLVASEPATVAPEDPERAAGTAGEVATQASEES